MNDNINNRTDVHTQALWSVLYPSERIEHVLENEEEFNQMCRIYNGIAKLYLDKSNSR